MTMRDVAGNIVDIWRLRIATAPVENLARALTTAEHEQAARFMRRSDRDRFVAVRGWLRGLLGEYLALSPDAVVFDPGRYGKPALPGQGGPEGIRFNVSHSGDFGIVAVSRGREVGVDIEEIRHDLDVVELGQSCLSTEEHETLLACDGDARIARFFDLWTAKEAYIKAMGSGLSISLQGFTVRLRSDRDTWSVMAPSVSNGEVSSIQRLAVPRGYAGAVTAFGTDWTIREQGIDGE